MTKLAQFPDLLQQMARFNILFDDFWDFVNDFGADTAGEIGDLKWITTGDTGLAVGTVIAGTNGSILSIAVGGTDNDEAYVESKVEGFLFAADRPIIYETLLKFTEGATNDANIFAGLMDNVAANALQNDGVGPKDTSSHMLFWKPDTVAGDTLWSVENSIGGTAKTTRLEAANTLTGLDYTAGGSFQKLRIEHHPLGGSGGTVADIMFFVDDVHVITHKDQTMASATEMSAAFGVKAGGANAETLLVDYVAIAQKR